MQTEQERITIYNRPQWHWSGETEKSVVKNWTFSLGILNNSF
jgi:hypothetical protein